MKRLCKQFGSQRLDKACRRALVLDCIQFKSIQSILEKGLDNVSPVQAVDVPITPEHENVRGANYYQQTEEELC